MTESDLRDPIFKGCNYVNVSSSLRVTFCTPAFKILDANIEGYVNLTHGGKRQDVAFSYYFSGDRTLLLMMLNNESTRTDLLNTVISAISREITTKADIEYHYTRFTSCLFGSI